MQAITRAVSNPPQSATGVPPRIEGPEVTIVSLGDSLTAGTQDGTTVQERQAHCYSKQLADYAHLPYNMPDIDNQGLPFAVFHDKTFDYKQFKKHETWLGLAMGPLGLWTYYIGTPPCVLPVWNLVPGTGNRTEASRNTPQHPQNDFAISGYKLRHSYNTANVQDYLREIHQGLNPIASVASEIPLIRTTLGNGQNNGTGSAVDQALKRNPDLIFSWAGNTDALDSIFGGVVDDRVLTPVDDRKWQFIESDPITGKQFLRETKNVIPGFRREMLGREGLLPRLLNGSTAEIVAVNIPDVTVIPILREVGKPVGKLPFHVMLADGTDVTGEIENWVVPDTVLGPGHGGRTQYPAGTRLSLITLLNKLVESGGPGNLAELQSRLATPAQGLLTEDDVLDPGELATISKRVSEYNQVLQDAAKANPRVHLIDMNALLQDALVHGRPLRGPGPDEWVVPGFTGAPDAQGRDGIFSYDGVHPSDTGHAIIANIILDKLRDDLKGDPRFLRFKNLPPLDEKAAHHADPHTPVSDNAIVLDKLHIDAWSQGKR